MNYYETLYIIHPALESGRLKDTILNVQKLIEKNKENAVMPVYDFSLLSYFIIEVKSKGVLMV